VSVILPELSWINYWMLQYHLQSCLPLPQNSTVAAPLAAPKFNWLLQNLSARNSVDRQNAKLGASAAADAGYLMDVDEASMIGMAS